MGSANHVHLTLDYVRETDKAILFSDGENEHWIPKSQIVEKAQVDEVEYEVVLPEWLAHSNGLI